MCELYYMLGFMTVFSPNPNHYAEGIDFRKSNACEIISFPWFLPAWRRGCIFFKTSFQTFPNNGRIYSFERKIITDSGER